MARARARRAGALLRPRERSRLARRRSRAGGAQRAGGGSLSVARPPTGSPARRTSRRGLRPETPSSRARRRDLGLELVGVVEERGREPLRVPARGSGAGRPRGRGDDGGESPGSPSSRARAVESEASAAAATTPPGGTRGPRQRLHAVGALGQVVERAEQEDGVVALVGLLERAGVADAASKRRPPRLLDVQRHGVDEPDGVAAVGERDA